MSQYIVVGRLVTMPNKVSTKVHWLMAGPRVACGSGSFSVVLRVTTQPWRVTCATCRRSLPKVKP